MVAGVGRGIVVTVELLRTRVVATGGWCDACLLPSAVELEHLLRIRPHGRPHYLQGTGCLECGAVDVEDLDLG